MPISNGNIITSRTIRQVRYDQPVALYCLPRFRPPLTPNDEKVFSMMVKEMFDKGDIETRKADIRTFNEVITWNEFQSDRSYHVRVPDVVNLSLED